MLLGYRRDDLHWTMVEERIFHMAGAQTPQLTAQTELIKALRETDPESVQQDTFYQSEYVVRAGGLRGGLAASSAAVQSDAMKTASLVAASPAAIVLLVGAPCRRCSTAHAQGLTNTIPSDQPPLSRVLAPSVAEQTPAGTGKFAIFTQEQTDKPGEWDFIAGAWERVPSRPEVPITKRGDSLEFAWVETP